VIHLGGKDILDYTVLGFIFQPLSIFMTKSIEYDIRFLESVG
jgi:DUF1365 family protein